MNTPIQTWIALALVSSALCVRAGVSDDLLPRVQSLQLQEGLCHFDPGRLVFRLSVEEKAAGTRLAGQIREVLDEIGVAPGRPPDIRVTVAKPGAGFTLLAANGRPTAGLPAWNPPAAQREGYQLQVSANGVAIGAAGESGLFYGLQTFAQLLNAMKVRGEKSLPCLEVRDWPALPMRGYSEDYGRNQLPTIDDHKRMIRFLARYKMNTYLWFIEPDHFVYQFDPTIGESCDRFRFEEIRQLVAYAREYHVEVIPTVELLGHMEGLLSHTNYSQYAEVPGQMDLCPTSDAAFAVVRKIVGEIAPAFESKYFHYGLDESFQVGKGQSARAVKEKGLERVMADYYIRMDDLLRSQGKTMMMYADIVLAHPGIMGLLPKDIVLMFWDYAAADRYGNFDKLCQAGYTVTSLSGLWDWAHLYPAYSYAFRNINALARQSQELNALGHFVGSWGDPFFSPGGLNLSELNTYGVAYAAAVSWKPGAIPIADFSKTYAASGYGEGTALAGSLTALAEFQGDGPFRGDLSYVRRCFEEDPGEAFKRCARADAEEMQLWQKTKEALGQVERTLFSVQPPRNRDRVKSLLLSTRLNLFAAEKMLALRAIAAEFGRPAFDKEKHARVVSQLADKLHGLAQEYRAIYLASNRPINMRYLEARYKEMVGQLRNFAAKIHDGTWKPD